MAEVLEGEIVVRQEADGRVVVVQAPPVARMALELLASAPPAVARAGGNTISLAGQVTYRVTGWDPHGSCLLLERVDDGPEQTIPGGFPPGYGTKGA